MRITNQLMNFNNVYNYQKNSNSLYQSQQAFSTGLKINYAYEGSGIYVDAARLEYESNLLKQVESTTLKATEFTKNSDKALNDFVLKLTEFKTKLIQAANDIHDATSRNAIANDLEGIKQNLIDIANTTINGQYLFSGTALDTMPIDDLGNYNGNAESIKAVIGTNQTSNYNINGESLFLGSDNDYKKVITTNVNLVNNYNKFLYPTDNEKFVGLNDDLRDLIGTNYRSEEYNKVIEPKEDDFTKDKLTGQDTTFFLQGRKPDGSTFSTKVTMTPDSSIQSLLDNIGYALGNDKDGKNPLVKVTLNNSGQIEITDIRNGNQMMELHLFGLTPQQSTEKYKLGDIEINIDPNTADDYKVTTTRDDKGNITEIKAVKGNDTYTITNNNGQIQVNGQNIQGNFGNPPFALDLNDLGNNGIGVDDFQAFDPNDAQQVREMSSTKVRDKDGSWVDVSALTDLETIEENVKNGKVYLTEFIKSDFKDTLGVKNDATDYNKLQFAQKDNILTGSVYQVVKGKNTFATDATKLKDVAGAGLQDNPNSNMTMHIKSKNGNYYEVKIQFTDPISASDPKATSLRIQEINQDGTPKMDAANPPQQVPPVYQGNIMLGKYNEATQKTDGVVTSANDISYKQINDIVAMVAAGNMPVDPDSNTFNENINRIYNIVTQLPLPGGIPNAATVKRELTARINDQEIVNIINNAVDEAFGNAAQADATIMQKIKDIVINDPVYATGRFEAYNKAVDAASASVNVELNYRGQMQVTDKSSTATNIEVTIFEEFSDGKPEFGQGANSSVEGSLFNFTANNMISIDEPSVDIFKDLDAMIAAVRDGSYRGNPDGTNARTTGIQGALKRIDHIQDHVNKLHTQIGSYTNVLESSNSRASMLYVNVESIKNDVIGADLGESMLIYKQYLTQFEAMLQTSSMISKISLLNYM